MPKPLTQLGQRGIGALLESLAYECERRGIAAGLAASGMRPWSNLSRGTAPLDEPLDKGAADTKQRCEGPLRAAVCVIGPENFLAKINGIGLHIAQTRPCLPSIQLQTAIIHKGNRYGRDSICRSCMPDG